MCCTDQKLLEIFWWNSDRELNKNKCWPHTHSRDDDDDDDIYFISAVGILKILNLHVINRYADVLLITRIFWGYSIDAIFMMNLLFICYSNFEAKSKKKNNIVHRNARIDIRLKSVNIAKKKRRLIDICKLQWNQCRK